MGSEKKNESATIFFQRHTIVMFCLVLFGACAGHAQTFSVLFSFPEGPAMVPTGGVTIDQAGNLYGATFSSNRDQDNGAVYKLSHRDQQWVFSVLYEFTQGSGDSPIARPVLGPDGSLYGTTVSGGTGCDLGCGNVYNLRVPITICRTALCYWTASTVWDFGSVQDDGAGPGYGDLLFGPSGNIYGTTVSTGLDFTGGTVFELTRSHGVWSETVIHQFGSGDDGTAPLSGMTRDSSGNLYGTTATGGTNDSCNTGNGCGTVYELIPSGSGWTEQVLYSFQGNNDGDTPVGGVVMDAAGNLYGTTSQDGAGGGGTVFELTHANGSWTIATLYSFQKTSSGTENCFGQNGNLLLDSAGNLYGTTCSNGAFGYGAVFKLAHSNGNWTYTSLHDFTNGNDGSYPVGNPSFDSSGNILGSASWGGASMVGTVWEVTP